MLKLVFGKANAKLKALEKSEGKKVYTFSLLAGHTCPGAKDCQSFAMENNGKLTIKDGKYTDFRCFAASQEVLFPSVYRARKNNLKIVELAAKSPKEAADLIVLQIPKNCQVLRLHASGDFKTQNYFDAWVIAATLRPDIKFYAYTKSIPFWVKRIGLIPSNLVLTASLGGKYDALAIKNGFKTVLVVDNEVQAAALNLPVDHDDSLALNYNGNFSLILHGTMPKGSKRKIGVRYNAKTGSNIVNALVLS